MSALESSDITNVLKSAAGRRVMWRILALCRLYDDDYADTNRVFYNNGRRAVGLDILQMLEEADPTNYPRLQLSQIEGANDGTDD